MSPDFRRHSLPPQQSVAEAISFFRLLDVAGAPVMDDP